MSLSMSQLTTPAFVQALDALAIVLGKARSHAAEHNIEEAALLQDRLYPDMFPLVRQVQTACDFAKGAVARLSGSPVPSFADDETSFADLQSRVARTLEVVRATSAASLDGSEERRIEIKAGARTLTFTGQDYLLSFVLPNFYFHLATAYGLLRRNGVVIGKRDFVGAARMS